MLANSNYLSPLSTNTSSSVSFSSSSYLSSSSSGEDYNNDIEKDAIDKGKSSIKKYKPTLRPGDDSKQI